MSSTTAPNSPRIVLGALALLGGAVVASAPDWKIGLLTFGIAVVFLTLARYALFEPADQPGIWRRLAAFVLPAVAMAASGVVAYRVGGEPSSGLLWTLAIIAAASASLFLNGVVDVLRQPSKADATLYPAPHWTAYASGGALILCIGAMTAFVIHSADREMSEQLAAHERWSTMAKTPLLEGLTLEELQLLDQQLQDHPELRRQARDLLDTQGAISKAQAERLRSQIATDQLFR